MIPRKMVRVSQVFDELAQWAKKSMNIRAQIVPALCFVYKNVFFFSSLTFIIRFTEKVPLCVIEISLKIHGWVKSNEIQMWIYVTYRCQSVWMLAPDALHARVSGSVHNKIIIGMCVIDNVIIQADPFVIFRIWYSMISLCKWYVSVCVRPTLFSGTLARMGARS